jgi:hypothetical protein
VCADFDSIYICVYVQEGRTLLHRAADSGILKVAEALVVLGADIEAKDKVWGYLTVHDMICVTSTNHLVLLYTDAYLHVLYACNTHRKIKYITISQKEDTPLIACTKVYEGRIADILLRNGAEVNPTDAVRVLRV